MTFAVTLGLPYSFYKYFIGSSKGVDHLIFEGRSGRFEKKFPAKPLQSKKIMQHEWLEKCIHSPKKIVPAPLASEEKFLH